MINIVYCADKKFLTQQVISLLSLVEHCKEPLNIINLTVEIPEFDKRGKKFTEEEDALCVKILKKVNANSSYRSIDISDIFREKLLRGPNLYNKYYSYYVTVRLLLPFIDEIPNKVIYLDLDTIFNGDISELWNINIDNYEFAGRKDLFRISNYLQSGVMLLNMKKIRETKSFENACRLCTEKKYISYIDMSAINTSCKRKLRIPKRYNSYKYTKNCIIHHVCSTREGFIPFTKKWNHRIKTDEIQLVRKFLPVYNDLYNRFEQFKLDNADSF